MPKMPLYWEDPPRVDFEAKVCRLEGDESLWKVVLDQSAFYPGGGGQPADKGILDGRPLLGIKKEGEEVVHHLAGPPPGELVRGEVDLPWRRDYQQQHTGQHILSAALKTAAGLDTLSVHLGERYTAIEVGASRISSETLEEVLQLADRWITEDHQVRSHFIEAEDAGDLGLRRPLKARGRVRVVEIEGIDKVGCGGVHLSSTREAGLILPWGQEKIRGGLRLKWLLGDRALGKARLLARQAEGISTVLSHPPEGLLEAVINLNTDLKEARYQLRQAEKREGIREAEAWVRAASPGKDGIKRIFGVVEGGREAVSGALESLQKIPLLWALLLSPGKKGHNWSLYDGTGSFPFKEFRTHCIEKRGGRGGGKSPLWQGQFPLETNIETIAGEFQNWKGVVSQRGDSNP